MGLSQAPTFQSLFGYFQKGDSQFTVYTLDWTKRSGKILRRKAEPINFTDLQS